jgi:hypothetical protein
MLFFVRGGYMHNLISYNQLVAWKNFENTLDRCNEKNDLINDYFNCLIECDNAQRVCKRICKDILTHDF